MNDSHKRRAIIVGIFVFLGLMFFLAGILLVGNLHETFTDKMEVVAHFDEVNGLQKGNNVWFSGVKIGVVSDVKFYGKSQVEVCIKFDRKVNRYIRKDAKVKISSDGLIGNKILVIYEGTDQANQIETGDTLMVEKTFSSEDMINTAQENNVNILAITNDVKAITKKLAAGEGSIGKLLDDSLMYTNINTTIISLEKAAIKAQQMLGSLADFSSNLNKKGTLANELTTDTIIFKSVKSSVLQLQQLTDTAAVFIANLKQAGANPNSAIGVLLHDEEAGTYLKESLKNLENSSEKLNEDLEAVQHNFLLRNYFKKQEKAAAKDSINHLRK